MRSPRLRPFAALIGAAAVVHAETFEQRVETLFRPPLGEMAAISPDGQRIAYTSPNGREPAIVMINLEPIGMKRTVPIKPEQSSAVPAEESPPPQLRFLRWATNMRLVFAPVERVVPLPPVAGANGLLEPNPDGPAIIAPILAVDADGRQRGTLIDAKHFQETPAEARQTMADLLRTTKELQATRNEAVRWRMPHVDILGFLPRDREQLIIGTRGAYSVPMQHLVDIRTGSVHEFGADWPKPPAEPQVFDWHRLKVVGERQDGLHPTTHWRDDDLSRLQRHLENKFPRRIVEILDWSETRARVLFRVTGGSDPGRVFVLQRQEDVVLEVFRRAPWLASAKLHETRFFEFKARDGAKLSGYVTWPTTPRQQPPPLLVSFPSGFPGRGQPAFDPEAQIFADLGFVVARLNHRGVGGVRPDDQSALRAAVDRLSVDDARAVIEALAAANPHRPFDRKRIVTLGRGFGGYLAMRALQLDPDAFRCGIAINAPMELGSWLQPATAFGANAPVREPVRDVPATLIAHANTDWRKLSVVDQADALTKPVLLLVEPNCNPAIEGSTAELHRRLQKLGRTCDRVPLESNFAAGHPPARVAAYRKIEEFFNLHLHGYAVKIGQPREVD